VCSLFGAKTPWRCERRNAGRKPDFVAGELQLGKMQMKGGSVYYDFKNNHWHGRGTLRLADGSTLTCAFTNG
jgi:hypothetical protein